MQSQMLKILLAIILSAGIAGGGVYYWQQGEFKNGEEVKEVKTVEDKTSKVEEKTEKEIVKEFTSTGLYELAKATKDNFTFLVSHPNSDSNWKVLVSNNFEDMPMRFSFNYKSASPWREIRYNKTDLTASDGASLEDLQGITGYRFCAGEYYCDSLKHEGMGFDLTFWNGKYKGKTADPKFYLKNGDILFKETDNFIITYKPFTNSSQAEVDKEVANLMSTFETF